MDKDNRSGFAVLIIMVGLSILLINLNVLRIEMFWGIVHLWPMFFVLAGLSILFRKVRHFDVVLWLVFFGIIIGYSYLNMDNKSWFFGDPVDNKVVEESFEIDNATFELDISTGNIVMNASDKMVYNLPEKNISRYHNEYDTYGEVIVSDHVKNDITTPLQNRIYNFGLQEGILWRINLDGAVFHTDIDLSQNDVEDFEVDFAIGNINLITSEYAGSYNIDFAMGTVMVDVPEDGNVRLHIDGGLSSTSVPSSFTEVNGYYYSENFDESKAYISVEIDLAIGSVEIK